MTLNVGVVGVGKIGQEHIRRLTETLAGARVVAVSDADSALAKEVAARLPGRDGLRDRRRAHRREGCRRDHRHVVGRDARGLCARRDQGGQAGVLREAHGDDGG